MHAFRFLFLKYRVGNWAHHRMRMCAHLSCCIIKWQAALNKPPTNLLIAPCTDALSDNWSRRPDKAFTPMTPITEHPGDKHVGSQQTPSKICCSHFIHLAHSRTAVALTATSARLAGCHSLTPRKASSTFTDHYIVAQVSSKAALDT